MGSPRGLLRPLTAALAVALALSASVAAPWGAPRAARAAELDDDWAALQSLLGGMTGVATAPIPNVASTKLTPGMLLGNGDVGVVAGGSTTTAQKLSIGKSDFWGTAFNPGHNRFEDSILSLGSLTIDSPTTGANPGP